MTRADLIEAVRTASGKPMMSERECLAIVRGVLGACRGGLSLDVLDAVSAEIAADESTPKVCRAMIDALLGEVGE